jgi:hypothetical protein
MNEIESIDFVDVGPLQAVEARPVLLRLVEEQVRFQVETDAGAASRMDGERASRDPWGKTAMVRLYVHREDQPKAGRVLVQYFAR